MPTVQVIGTSSPTRLTSIPVVANLPNQQPQQAGTLILPGGRSVNVQSANTQSATGLENGTQIAVNTSAQSMKKELYYLTPDASGKLQLLPMIQNKNPQAQYPTTNPESSISSSGNLQNRQPAYQTVSISNTEMSQTTNFEEHVHFAGVKEGSRESHNLKECNSMSSRQENCKPEGMNDEASNVVLEISRNLVEHCTYLTEKFNTLDPPSKSDIVTGNSANTSSNASIEDTANIADEGINAIVSLVKYRNIPLQREHCENSPNACEKENNFVSSGYCDYSDLFVQIDM